MTSHELARLLLDGPDLSVHFAYNFGDYWRTIVAREVENVEPGKVAYSGYHRLDTVVQSDDEDESGHAGDPVPRTVVLIS